MARPCAVPAPGTVPRTWWPRSTSPPARSWAGPRPAMIVSVIGFLPSSRGTCARNDLCGRSRRSRPGLLLAAVDREGAVLAVVLLVQVPQGVHVLVGDDEIHVGVGPHVLGVTGLRQRHGAQLQGVADAQLRN